MSKELSEGIKDYAKAIRDGWIEEGKKEVISEFVEDLKDCFDNGIFNLSMFNHKKEKWEKMKEK